jgi:hypothetical protein
LRRLGAFAAALVLVTAVLAQDDAPEGDIVTATQISRFQGVDLGGTVGNLIWRGGIVLTSQADRFGGISGLAFSGPDGRFATVSDIGNFITGQLIYDEAGHPFGLVGIAIDAIQNSKGVDLPRQFARDAEAMTLITRDGAPAAVRVGFENLTRVADFQLVDGVPTGAAKEVTIPEWLTDERTNESLEAVCIAPSSSPIAGSTLLLTEDVAAQDGEHSAWLLGVNDRGPLTLAVSPGVNPTDCAFLPNGDLLVLERGVSLLSFTMILKRIAAADVRPGARMDGEVLLRASGGDIDNLEALAVHEGPGGETRITLMSDSNFNDWQRNLLLEFALAD